MKDYQSDFFYNRNTTLKKKLLLLTTLFCLLNLNAQVSLRIEPGVLLDTDSEDFALSLNIEPKVKISENTVIGLRFGIALNPQKFKINNNSQFFIDNQQGNAVISFIPNMDYYLNANNYRPYLGIGLGYYLFNYSDVRRRNGSTEILEGIVNNQLGFLLRGGLEIGNTRYGLEYNLIPKADIEVPNEQIIGSVNNSYLGLSIGFTIGGRKS